MAGFEQLLRAVEAAVAQDEDAVLVTVVKVEGSAYRRPGARMLITALGQTEGTISGGCLESEVARTAWWLTEQGPALRIYSTSDEEQDGDVAVSFGLGCNGKVHILFERMHASAGRLLLDGLSAVQADGQGRALATLVSSTDTLGQRLLLTADGTVQGQLASAALQEQVATALQTALVQRSTSLHCFQQAQGEVQVLVEYLAPARRLLVFGGGHDAQPLVRMAKLLGWQVCVIDSRAHFARSSRFPEADSVLLGQLDDSFDPLPLLQGAAVAIMTHSLQQDAHWLACALRSEATYIGQLGPRDRTERLLRDIPPQAISVQALERLHYPIGLDLGADNPESVAMAILAEMTAVLNGREGGMLKRRGAAIHDLPATHYHQTAADAASQPVPLLSTETD